MPKAIHNCKQTPLLAYTSAQRKQEYRTLSYLLPQDDLSDNKLMASWRRSAVPEIQQKNGSNKCRNSYWMAVHRG